MALIKRYKPLTSQVDRWFDDLLTDGFGVTRRDFARGFNPTVNISETEKSYKVEAELPGVDEKDINSAVKDGYLTISGEKKHEIDEKKENYHLVERSYGSFSRTIALTDDIDTEKIDAKFKKGVVTIDLPKNDKAQPKVKKISVKSE